ncbi:MAG: sugar porter family MFS transporter [Marinilabiliaceae bacterium]|nr:sugar porter family MFS transporter [Marinilabiliaceae bacterium]
MKKIYNKNFILGITLVSAMGGLLFGYDWVVIGGAKPFYERFFEITNSTGLQGWVMSSALIGCLIGAILSGLISDKYGRKQPLILAAFLFTLSAIGTGAVDSLIPFVLYRLIGGVGIGLASAISPMYIAEISPSEIRGRLVSVNQLTIVIGILAAQIVNYFIAEEVPKMATNEFIQSSWNGQIGWRYMFWAETIPALLFFVLAFFIPESPRYLIKAGNTDRAIKTLSRIGGEKYAATEELNIHSTISKENKRVNWSELFTKKLRPLIILGIVLAAFQQWCGINVIFNYAEEIFTSAGYSVGDMMFNIVITGIVNLLFTLIAMQTVDKLGRRKLMLIGSASLALIYTILGTCYFLQVKGLMVLILVVLAIAAYAMTLAPITWVLLSEIFPNRIRGAAMSLATTVLWIACFALTYSFPILNEHLNASGTFWLYALICISGFFFIFKKVVETKGKSLEEIENQYHIS